MKGASDLPFRHAAARYLFALATVAGALVVKLLLVPLTEHGAPFLIFFAAVLVTTLYAGTGPGLLALAISLLLGAYVFVVRAGWPVSQAAVQALLYAVDALVIVAVATLANRRRGTLDEMNRELRQLRDVAVHSEKHAREVIELAPDAFFMADLEGRFTDVNHAACRLLGYERDELLALTVFGTSLPEDAERLKAVRARLLTPGATLHSEWTLRHKNGSHVPVEISANILPDGRWQAFIRDNSERKRVEDQRQVFVSLLDNSIDFIGIADLMGKPIYLNPAGRRMIGLAPDFPVEQLQIEDCYPPELRDFVTNELLAMMKERGAWSGDTYFQHFATREKIPVSDTHFLIRDETGQRVLGMGTVTRDMTAARHDATERERLIAEEQAARRQLELANARRDEVLGIVAHDLRNPLHAITMATAVLSNVSTNGNPGEAEARGIILRAAKRMNQLIEDLLDVAQIEAGQLKIDPTPLAAADVVREAATMQEPLANGAKVELRTEVAHDLGLVLGDHKRLLQVFDNLIGNAIKFTPPGGRIVVRAKPEDGHVRFSVSDTGQGIAPQTVTHIFDRFWQAATRERRLGAGLGLPITRGIVEAHGGEMEVESALGRGSTFSFTIPRAGA